MLPEITKSILRDVCIVGQFCRSAQNISETQLQCASDMTSLQSGFLTGPAPLELSVAVPGSVALLTAALLLQLAAAPHLPAYQQAILSCIAQAPGSKCQCSYEQDPSY